RRFSRARGGPARRSPPRARPREDGTEMPIIGSMRRIADTRGAVRVEVLYDTDIEDLWRACTEPERLARWIGEVAGDLRPGGIVRSYWARGWSGPARIDACGPPRYLRLT